MDGLQVGRVVHYVNPTGVHCSANVAAVQDKPNGIVALVVMSPTPIDGSPIVFGASNVRYSDTMEPETWHWPERA